MRTIGSNIMGQTMRSTITDTMSTTKRQEAIRKSGGSSIYYGTDKQTPGKRIGNANRSYKSSAANTASKRSVDSNYTKQSKADSIKTGKSSVASKAGKSSRPQSSGLNAANLYLENQREKNAKLIGQQQQPAAQYDLLHMTRATRGANIQASSRYLANSNKKPVTTRLQQSTFSASQKSSALGT